MITKTVNLHPQIKQYFNPLLLLTTLQRYEWDVDKKIIRSSLKRLRGCSGRQKKFDKLLLEFRENYERKKIEEAEYKAACQKKREERPGLPLTNSVIRFKRIHSRE